MSTGTEISFQINLNNNSNRRNARMNRRSNIFNVNTNNNLNTSGRRIFNVITVRNNNNNTRHSNNRNRRIRIRRHSNIHLNNLAINTNNNTNNTTNNNLNNNINYNYVVNNIENINNNNINIVEDWILNLLPRSIINDVDKLKEKECAICLGNFKVSDEIMSIPCFHMFHSYCIKQWLAYEKICPICKFKITRESILS